jgi:signal transduction histidine kinase
VLPDIIDRFRVRRTSDIAVCRERTRAVAAALGLYQDDAARAATAAAETARALVGTGVDGEVTLEVVDAPRAGLAVVFHTDTPLQAPLDPAWDPLRAAVSLSDEVDQRRDHGSCQLRLVKYAPPLTDLAQRTNAARDAAIHLGGEPSLSAMRSQNLELTRLLDEVRRRGRELERMNEELRDAHNAATAAMLELRELGRKKDELQASIAHDLRSPLAALRGALDILQDGLAGPLGPEQHRYLDIARRSSSHMQDLVNDILDSALLDAGLASVRTGPVSLRSVIDEVEPTIAFLAREKSIGFQVQLPDGLPHVQGDAHKIGQILANLLTNAVKFTDGGGLVRVCARVLDDRRVLVEVSDSGIGIASGRVEDLFDKYRRTPSRGTRGERGTGLGLYICRRLVELHGGQLTVESDLGSGTTFRFTLPYALAVGGITVAEAR